ncbi:hypothetical protein L1987_09553 [Smallanthus sonchifolius]|uniref:Uncharacterized protein n=1 Tax=Smallanthus sonchifolius TaxID=185202 RepID=A0ACB9JP31_9ASTR|nr:hypothetical protein L1987_09553 [Smallanthus sonchifolius]
MLSYTIKSISSITLIVRGGEIEHALSVLGSTVPTVFIGGELVGGANEIMSLHLKRDLKPMLIKAGALWVGNHHEPSSFFCMLPHYYLRSA